MIFVNTLAPVKNRDSKRLPVFLEEMVKWARGADDVIFAPNPNPADVYAAVSKTLGPYENLLHRKAVMLEVLRVLAGFESSWNFNEGRDTKNTPLTSPQIEHETGVFQVSANAMAFGADLRKLVTTRCGTTAASMFIIKMKTDHVLAFEFAARLLRHTIKHNGPVLRHEIDPYLSRAAVGEFIGLLT